MRLVLIGVAAAVLLAAVFAATLILSLPSAHVAALVPDDALFVFTARNLNDLRDAYGGQHARRDFDAARDFVGIRANLPELTGLSYQHPLAIFLTEEYKEVLVLPYRDWDAMESAFEDARADVHLRDPERVSDRYASISRSELRARARKDNALVLEALEYPIGFVLRPSAGEPARALHALLMRYLLDADSAAAFLQAAGDEIGAAFAWAGRAVDTAVLGATPNPAQGVAAEIEGSLRLVDGGPLDAGDVARRANLARLVQAFPRRTLLFAAAALDEDGWRSVGLGPLGPAAAAAGVVRHMEIHPRPNNLLVAVRPLAEGVLGRLEEAGASALTAHGAFETMDDGGALVRTAPVEGPPGRFPGLFQAQSEDAPPIFVCTTVEDGIWLCAVGSQAQAVIRLALSCLRGSPELSLAATAPVSEHEGFLAADTAAAGMFTVRGMRQLGAGFPSLIVGGVGPPSTVTFSLGAGDPAPLRVRLLR